MAIHSSILAWRIPRTEEPGGPQSMGSLRVRHDLTTKQQQRQAIWERVTGRAARRGTDLRASGSLLSHRARLPGAALVAL